MSKPSCLTPIHWHGIATGAAIYTYSYGRSPTIAFVDDATGYCFVRSCPDIMEECISSPQMDQPDLVKTP